MINNNWYDTSNGYIVYLVNFKDFSIMNKVYASYFDKTKLPARTCIGVTELAVGASIEIDFIAGI